MTPALVSPLALQEGIEPTRAAAEARLPLFGELAFSDPIFLALVPVTAILVWYGHRARHAAARVPSLPADLPRSARQRLTWIVPVSQAAALLCSVFALARPLRGNVELTSTTEGVDICLVVDRSSSMEARERPGAPTRFEVVKEVVGDFASRRMTDREGAADNIALIGFALYPELFLPFTLDVDAMQGALDRLRTEQSRELDATGIGIALAKAVQVLRGSEARSRIVVLLTDGLENVEAIRPLEAAALAAEEGIRVYTIFAGPKVVVRRGLFGEVARIPIDTAELERVAEVTSGRFWQAEGKEDLQAVYAEIETLERTEREESRFAEQFDLYPRLVLAALGFYVLSWLSATTWARRLP